MDADTLWNLAVDARAAVVAHYATVGEALPDRQLVVAGQLPAWDCELLAVSVEQVYGHTGTPALPAQEATQAAAGFALRAASLLVTLVREAAQPKDNGDPPTVAAEEVAARQLLRDAVLCLDALRAAAKAGDLGGCRTVVLDQWLPSGPDGGLVGGVLRVRVGLEG